jgi:hypothetical protein
VTLAPASFSKMVVKYVHQPVPIPPPIPPPHVVGVERTLIGGEGQTVTDGGTLPLPPHRAGDILIVGVAHAYPAKAAAIDVSGFTQKIDHQNGSHSFQIWWRRALADNETGPTLTHTFTDLEHRSWKAIVATGCVTSGDPFDTTATQNTSGGTHTGPSVTTSVINCGILLIDATFGTVTFDGWTNSTVAPREIVDVIYDDTSHDMALGMGWGHKAAIGATGTWTVTVTPGVGGSTATLALKPDPNAVTTTQSSYRDSTISSEPATGSTITLPGHIATNRLTIVLVGNDGSKVDAATLSAGWTKRFWSPIYRHASYAIFTRVATSASETNPTITHTFGAGDDWVVFAFSTTKGDLVTLTREAAPIGTTVIVGTYDIEVDSPSLIVGICASQSVTFNSLNYADTGGTVKRQEGGPTAFKCALFTSARPAVPGWVGYPTWTISIASKTEWVTLGYTETT